MDYKSISNIKSVTKSYSSEVSIPDFWSSDEDFARQVDHKDLLSAGVH